MEGKWIVILILGIVLLITLLIFRLWLLNCCQDLPKTKLIPSTESVEADPSCQISVHLDPTSTDFYFTGQTVSGVVVLNSSGKTLNTKVNGCAYVVIYDGPSEAVEEEKESFVFIKTSLVKENSSFDEVTGRQYFPFSFVIPPESPASFEGGHGHVRYSMKAVLKRQHFTRLVFSSEVLFKCQRTVDLTRDALMLLRQPRFQRKYENLIKSIQVTAWLDKSAYIPGEKIQFNAKIQNGSSKSVMLPTVKFVQYTTFRYRNQSTEVLWEQRAGKIFSNDEQIWDNVLIPVASVPPTGYPYHTFIHTSYAIEITLGHNCKKYVAISVMIGTTPIPEINRRAEALPSLVSESANSETTLNDNLAGVNSSSADSPPPYFPRVPRRHRYIRTIRQGSESPPPNYDSVV